MPSYRENEKRAQRLAKQLDCPENGDEFLLFCWHFNQAPVEAQAALFEVNSEAGQEFRRKFLEDLDKRSKLSIEGEVPHSTTAVARGGALLRG